MRWLSKVALRCRSLFRGQAVERELDDEVRFHLERQIEVNVAAGMPPEEARYAALREFGGTEQVKEECREKRGVALVDDFLRDFRYAARALRKSPGFAAVAILSLALGIGANAAIFSVIDGVLLRPLSYRDPGRLFAVREVVPALSKTYPTLPVNARHFDQWQKQCSSFEEFAAVDFKSFNVSGQGEPERVAGALVSWNAFQLLGVQPRLGRAFLPDEDRRGHDGVVVLADSLWRRRYSADPGIAGKTIFVEGQPHLVTGVLPASFRMPQLEASFAGTAETEPEVFKPIAMDLDGTLIGDFNYEAFARLKPGVSRQQALSEMALVQSRIASQISANSQLGAVLQPLQERVVGQVRKALLVLFAAVGAVLLMVCVNIANLQLARALRRMRESAIRAALGATWQRVMRQMLTESALLAGAGGALGLLFARWGLRALVNAAPIALPRLNEVRLDLRVVLFAFLVSALTALLFGVLPALRLARAQPIDALRDAGPRATEGQPSLRLRKWLLAAEVGISFTLLVVAGLLLASFVRLATVEKGFRVENVLTMDLKLPGGPYGQNARIEAFYQRMLENVERVPGVLAAGLVSRLPLQGEAWGDAIVPEGTVQPSLESMDVPLGNYRFVSAGYFSAMGIALRAGRVFQESDRGRSTAVISQKTAERLWPGQSPVGKHFHRGNPGEPPFEIIGVAADVRSINLADEPKMFVYVPYWYRQRAQVSLVVRSGQDPRGIAGSVRTQLYRAEPQVAVANLKTMRQVMDDSLAPRRFQLALVLLFAASALLLACLGIYGLVAEGVARRTNEIGIRLALGATPKEVRRLVVVQALAPVGAGMVAGLAASLAFGRLIGSLLFGVSATDPVTIGGVALVLLVVALAACYLPARRATRVDPMLALRCE